MIRGQRETLKSVKVDNWGTFFLQKLQNFFNKTDYCDLTLQFQDNSQLKVHRLVLSACTDYFNMLEQSCEMMEDILIMPPDLQADVIVPIVNFMYTGTLEFQYNMYDKLLKTSREMNMTVLSKLLEAHRQTSGVNVMRTQPVVLNKNATAVRAQPRVFHQKPLPSKAVLFKQGQTIIKQVSPTKSSIPEPIQIVTRYQTDKNNSRPSRFIVPDEIVPDTEGSFESISYESKPLLTASQMKREEENSPFESLRRGYTNNKRVASTSASQSPPTKKPNLDDIKAEAEAQRQRNEISGDGEEVDDNGSDPDYDADQYFEENEDSEDEGNRSKNSSGTIVKSTTKQITVNDCSGGNIDHAKILGEVLKKYPGLVKNPKNIKLKIMQKPSNSNSPQTTAIVRVVKQEPAGTPRVIQSAQQQRPPIQQAQPKKIDAKTMHELIRLGPENIKGPWLCLECGSGGRPISIPSYKKYRAHLVNVHKQKIDPRICEHCGLKPARRIELIQHQLVQHNISPPADVQLFRCMSKGCVFVSQREEALMKHKRDVHKEFQQKCKFCSKVFGKEFLLHAHMRAVHRHMAKSDEQVEYSEDEEYDPANSSTDEKKMNKIEILSNIEIPASEALKYEVVSQPSSEAEALTSVASGIATSLGLADSGSMSDDQFNIEQQLAQVHGEFEGDKKNDAAMFTKLVAEDGTELELTAAQKEEILQQLQSQGASLTENVVMVLDQAQLNAAAADNNIMVMFSEPQETSTSDSIINNVSSIKPEEIEKAEIVFQDDNTGVAAAESKAVDGEKSKLISDLEQDWTEDDEPKSEEQKTSQEDSLNESQTQFTVIDESKEEEESSEKKNILNDWQEEEELETKTEDNSQDQSEAAEEPEAGVPEKEEAKDSQPEETSTEVAEETEKMETEEEKTPKVEAVAPADKPQLISELLEEWNDI